MWEFFIKGGLVMIPLGICSFMALVIIIERILFYFFTGREDSTDETGIIHFLSQGKFDEVKAILLNNNSALGRITEAALEQVAKDPSLLETALQSAGDDEVKRLQRGLGLLDTIVTASPLLGLLGTVTGIIRSFTALSVGGITQATHLSLGIAEALYTTAFGLSIAIPALFFLNLYYGIAERRAERLTCACQEILSVLNKG